MATPAFNLSAAQGRAPADASRTSEQSVSAARRGFRDSGALHGSRADYLAALARVRGCALTCGGGPRLRQMVAINGAMEVSSLLSTISPLLGSRGPASSPAGSGKGTDGKSSFRAFRRYACDLLTPSRWRARSVQRPAEQGPSHCGTRVLLGLTLLRD